MFNLLAGAEAALGATGIGFLPIVVWLTFWLFEDWKHPEPRRVLIIAFLTGMCAVPVVLSLEGVTTKLIPYGRTILIAWAAIEEAVKFGMAGIFVLRSRSVDEPIDYVVYMITVALGFAAVENSLFLFAPFIANNFLESAVTGDLRFIGPTLIHVLGSAIIGGALAFSFFRTRLDKVWYVAVGLILAVGLHAFFNFLIITTGAGRILTVFLGVWVGIIFILLALERIKLLRPPAWWEKIFTSAT